VVVVEEAYPLAFTCVLDPGWWSGENQAGSWATVSPHPHPTIQAYIVQLWKELGTRTVQVLAYRTGCEYLHPMYMYMYLIFPNVCCSVSRVSCRDPPSCCQGQAGYTR